MKVLLVQPPSVDPLTDQIFLFEPLALEYLGAGLKEDGMRFYCLMPGLTLISRGVCRKFQPDVVGLTGFTSHVNIIKRIAARIKSMNNKVLIVVGGHHATVQAKDFNDPNIDVVVIGEGVFTLREILDTWRKVAISRPFEASPPRPEAMTFNPPRPYTDLNELPFPDRSLTAVYRKNYFSEWFKPLASVRTSLGCTGRCNFCSLWKITGGKYLRRDPEKVVEELLTVAESNVFFCDDESMCDVNRMDKLADLIAEAGIKKIFPLWSGGYHRQPS